MAQFNRFILVPAALLALSACATPGPGTPGGREVASAPADEPSSVYGLYLAGQVALDAADNQRAAELFGRAQAISADGAFMKEKLFSSALLAGELDRAAAAAPGPGEGSPDNQALGILVQAVEALAQGQGEKSYARLAAPRSKDLPFLSSLELLKPWAAAAAGRWPAALAVPATNDRLSRLIASLDQAMLFERAHRNGEAETAFKALLAQKNVDRLIIPTYGGFLERRGRRAEAIGLYNEILAESPDDALILAARARAMAKAAPPPQPSIREGAAQALLIQAETLLAAKESVGGLEFLRMVLRLDPDRDDGLLLAGDVLAAAGDPRGARACYEKVGPKSINYVDARTRLAWSYQTEDKAMALKIAHETIAARPKSEPAQLALAYLLRADERFEESITVLDPLIASPSGAANWQLYYMRAVALERSGRWPDAQRDLDKALSLRPDEPEVLNYLGYSWVNRGERVKDGMAMIQKAVAAQPDEGAFVDSLGWAYYRLGDYPNAVETLEYAVMLDAGDAEINDHLGDAYWRSGRRDEAKFQWDAVLTMKPDPDVKARVEAKLASALGPDAVAAPTTTAAVAHP